VKGGWPPSSLNGRRDATAMKGWGEGKGGETRINTAGATTATAKLG